MPRRRRSSGRRRQWHTPRLFGTRLPGQWPAGVPIRRYRRRRARQIHSQSVEISNRPKAFFVQRNCRRLTTSDNSCSRSDKPADLLNTKHPSYTCWSRRRTPLPDNSVTPRPFHQRLINTVCTIGTCKTISSFPFPLLQLLNVIFNKPATPWYL